MIKIKSFASGSSGNCALIYNENAKILLDCGIPINNIISELNKYNILITDINSVLLSHAHLDHTHACKDIEKWGIDIFSSQDVINAYGLKNATSIDKTKRIGFNDIDVIPLKVQHGDCECYAFIFHDKDSLILFATDFMLMEQNLKAFPFTEIYIETNYNSDIIQKYIESSDELKKLKYLRQINTHCSVENAIKYLSNMDLSQCKKIVGIHLSSGVANKDKIKYAIQNKFGIPTYCLNKKGEEV